MQALLGIFVTLPWVERCEMKEKQCSAFDFVFEVPCVFTVVGCCGPQKYGVDFFAFWGRCCGWERQLGDQHFFGEAGFALYTCTRVSACLDQQRRRLGAGSVGNSTIALQNIGHLM
jgi:hypothetical protein